MKLDCIKTNEKKWRIIDYDKGCEPFVISDSDTVEEAWYLAAAKLENMVNSALETLAYIP